MRYQFLFLFCCLPAVWIWAQTPPLHIDGKEAILITDPTTAVISKTLSIRVEFDELGLGGGIFLLLNGREIKLPEYRQVSAGSRIAAAMTDMTNDSKPDLILEITTGSFKSLLIYHIKENDYDFIPIVYAKKQTIAAMPEAIVEEAKFYIEKNKLYMDLMKSTSTIVWDNKTSKMVYHINKKLK